MFFFLNHHFYLDSPTMSGINNLFSRFVCSLDLNKNKEGKPCWFGPSINFKLNRFYSSFRFDFKKIEPSNYIKKIIFLYGTNKEKHFVVSLCVMP